MGPPGVRGDRHSCRFAHFWLWRAGGDHPPLKFAERVLLRYVITGTQSTRCFNETAPACSSNDSSRRLLSHRRRYLCRFLPRGYWRYPPRTLTALPWVSKSPKRLLNCPIYVITLSLFVTLML